MEENEEGLNINFKALFSILYKEKWLIIGITLLFGILGYFYASSLQEEFVSEGKILPEISSGKSGGMGQFAGLAALAGVDISGAGGGADAVRPDLYPDVLKSTPFFLQILKSTFHNKKSKLQTLEKHLTVKSNDEQSDKPLYPTSNKYITISPKEAGFLKALKGRITCLYDKKTGIISISAKMPDPVLAAEVANYSMDYLTDYMISYRTEKQKRDLNFLAERLAAAKGKYFVNQERKASYSDQLPLAALRLQTADLQRERIESEYKISSTFYNSLLQKYEEAKLKIQQETPVIKVLEPAVVPNKKSEPNKRNITALFMFFGLIITSIFIYIKRSFYA